MLQSDLNELKVLTNRSNVVLLYNIYTLNVSVGPHQLRRLSWHPHDNKIVFFFSQNYSVYLYLAIVCVILCVIFL